MEDTLNALEEGRVCVLSNPALDDPGMDAEEAARKAGLTSHCVFRTSGSTGAPKYVCLSLDALTASARAVNEFLGTGSGDKWVRAIPFFHVGGFGASLRAHLAGIPCESFDGKWNAGMFVDCCRKAKATMTSLVPAQLHDLASEGHACPRDLRVVLAGGGWLSNRDWKKLLELGWPVRMTYGLTEACSQVATDPGDGEMRVLSIWETRVHGEGRLSLRGPALLSGYLEAKEGTHLYTDPRDADGWFLTRDLVKLDGRMLEFAGRVDRFVKVLGELVDLDSLEERARETATVSEGQLAIVALPDPRLGFRLLAAIGKREESRVGWVVDFNQKVAGFEKLEGAWPMDDLPRTGAGKIDRGALQRKFESGG